MSKTNISRDLDFSKKTSKRMHTRFNDVFIRILQCYHLSDGRYKE